VNPRLLDIANAYLGLWSKLEYVDVWYTPPLYEPERRSSQRWHRDFNDRHLLKAFVYLVDVDEGTGPFEYVPRSAPGGELDQLWPWRPLGDNYPPQDELERRVDGRAVTFTAPKGTLIFCNTSGFHRGGFATANPRVLATFTWDSPASLKALSERNYVFESGEELTGARRYALS
jgi:ectoine hydroxylase-related dioxygenase (phytanoyl-CoA dioxygenase family)